MKKRVMKPVKAKRKQILKRYDFGFEGMVLGGSAIVLAYSLQEARDLLKKENGMNWTPWVERRSSFSAIPQVVNFDDGDY